VELGNLEKLRAGSPETFAEHLEDAKRLAAETLGSVRNLAQGLRPSMLDDLGLGPALEWQARDPIDQFARRLLADGVLSRAELDRVRDEVRAELEDAVAAARISDEPPPDAALRYAYATTSDPLSP
jgi:signal transduction histidine kinase